MTQPATTTAFAGVDGRTDAQLPAWYARTHSDPVSFAEAIRELPQAIETDVAYRNRYSGEWTETDRFNALVEPVRLYKQATGEPDEDPLFHVPTDSYSIINPVDVYSPLEEVLRTEELDGVPLGEVVFGEVRQYRGGGEVHMDVLFDGLSVDLPGRDEPLTMGVTTGYDFFGGHAVYVEGFAQDGYCSNTMRRLTDRESVKHVGDVGDFEAWWEDVLGELGLVADDLAAFIEDAMELTVDFAEMPFDLETFYELLGFPEYLATRAAGDARAGSDDPFDVDLWTLHSGGTYALTHHFSGKEGSAMDRYVRIANDVLFNPEATVERVERAYEEQVAAEEGSQSSLDDEQGRASIEHVGDDIRAKSARFEAREETLRERFQRATN